MGLLLNGSGQYAERANPTGITVRNAFYIGCTFNIRVGSGGNGTIMYVGNPANNGSGSPTRGVTISYIGDTIFVSTPEYGNATSAVLTEGVDHEVIVILREVSAGSWRMFQWLDGVEVNNNGGGATLNDFFLNELQSGDRIGYGQGHLGNFDGKINAGFAVMVNSTESAANAYQNTALCSLITDFGPSGGITANALKALHLFTNGTLGADIGGQSNDLTVTGGTWTANSSGVPTNCPTGSTVNLVGTHRGYGSRSYAQGATMLALAGRQRAAPARARASGTTTVALAGRHRTTPTRSFGSAGSIVVMTGTARATPARSAATMTTTLALQGRHRSSSSRGRGSMVSIIALAGVHRSTPGRMLGPSMDLGVYACEQVATPSRAWGQMTTTVALQGRHRSSPARACGLMSFTAPGTLEMAGTMRVTQSRGFGQLVTSVALAGAHRASAARQRGTGGTTVALAGAHRSTPSRLVGLLTSLLGLRGTHRATPDRGRGFLTLSVPGALELFGIHRATPAAAFALPFELNEPEVVPAPGKYARQHASALAAVGEKGIP